MSAPTVVRTPAELRELGGGVAFVPTMGALHDGHIQLMKHARPLGQTLVASIFVNPTQFAPGEYFEDYPRRMRARLGDETVFDTTRGKLLYESSLPPALTGTT